MSLIITGAILKLMRTADTVIFRTNTYNSALELRHQADGLPESCSELAIPANLDSYSGMFRKSYDTGTWTAFEMSTAAKWNAAIRTAFTLLKAGDEISLLWGANIHANDYARSADLNVDTLDLVAARKDQRLVFHISTRVCPSNTARMIQLP